MALNWTDKQNGVDDILAEDINDIANAVIELEKKSGSSQKIEIDQNYKPNSENAQSGKAVAEAIENALADIDNTITNAVASAVNSAKSYTDEKVGDIETALDSIIAMQNSLIGGDA